MALASPRFTVSDELIVGPSIIRLLSDAPSVLFIMGAMQTAVDRVIGSYLDLCQL